MNSSEHPNASETRGEHGAEAAEDGSPEVGISSLVDGELPAGGSEGLLQLIDRLVDSPELQQQYRGARALGGLLETLEPTADAEPPYEIWQKIATATQQPTGSRRWSSKRRAPAESRGAEGRRPGLSLQSWSQPLLAAAALTCAVLATLWIRSGVPTPSLPTGSEIAAIEVGARAGLMNERRFFQIATEILEADRSYRRQLIDLVSAVEREMTSSEIRPEVRREDVGSRAARRDIDSVDGESDRGLRIGTW